MEIVGSRIVSRIIWSCLFLISGDLLAARVKDIANIRGFRSNSLIGYGLVVGLAGTGDSAASLSTMRAASNLLTSLGVNTKESELVAGSYASVIVTAQLPPFSRNGDKIDIRLSAVGDASSLAGGTLLLTPLEGVDSEVYAIGQGAVVVGQASGSGTEVLTVAHVSRGGTVEREFLPKLDNDDGITLSLKNADFATNYRLVKKINRYFGGIYAKSLNPSSIWIAVPPAFVGDVVAFVARLESLEVDVDRKAVVVMNEKTGTVVLGKEVMIEPITVAHGNLSISVKGPSEGDVGGEESVVSVKGTSVGTLAEILNNLGVSPKDLIDILRTMHRAGALHAELDVL